MKTTVEYLDQAKQRLGITSDYALAKHLGIRNSAIGNYRACRSHIAPTLAPKLAEMAGEDEAAVLLTAQIERSATPEERAIWERLLRRIGKGAACYVISSAIVAGVALSPAPARAAASNYAAVNGDTLQIMRSRHRRRAGRVGRRRHGFRPDPHKFVTVCKKPDFRLFSQMARETFPSGSCAHETKAPTRSFTRPALDAARGA